MSKIFDMYRWHCQPKAATIDPTALPIIRAWGLCTTNGDSPTKFEIEGQTTNMPTVVSKPKPGTRWSCKGESGKTYYLTFYQQDTDNKYIWKIGTSDTEATREATPVSTVDAEELTLVEPVESIALEEAKWPWEINHWMCKSSDLMLVAPAFWDYGQDNWKPKPLDCRNASVAFMLNNTNMAEDAPKLGRVWCLYNDVIDWQNSISTTAWAEPEDPDPDPGPDPLHNTYIDAYTLYVQENATNEGLCQFIAMHCDTVDPDAAPTAWGGGDDSEPQNHGHWLICDVDVTTGKSKVLYMSAELTTKRDPWLIRYSKWDGKTEEPATEDCKDRIFSTQQLQLWFEEFGDQLPGGGVAREFFRGDLIVSPNGVVVGSNEDAAKLFGTYKLMSAETDWINRVWTNGTFYIQMLVWEYTTTTTTTGRWGLMRKIWNNETVNNLPTGICFLARGEKAEPFDPDAEEYKASWLNANINTDFTDGSGGVASIWVKPDDTYKPQTA